VARLLGCAFVVGVAVWLACGPRVSAAAVDCGKPVAPCTACYSPMLTQNYSHCAAKPWTPPPEAKELYSPLSASPKVIAEGKANYGIFCEGCHGPRADGAGPIAIKFSIPVADLTTPQVQQQNDGELFWKLSHGYGACRDGAMCCRMMIAGSSLRSSVASRNRNSRAPAARQITCFAAPRRGGVDVVELTPGAARAKIALRTSDEHLEKSVVAFTRL
jgi:hypothetical protein